MQQCQHTLNSVDNPTTSSVHDCFSSSILLCLSSSALHSSSHCFCSAALHSASTLHSSFWHSISSSANSHSISTSHCCFTSLHASCAANEVALHSVNKDICNKQIFLKRGGGLVVLVKTGENSVKLLWFLYLTESAHRPWNSTYQRQQLTATCFDLYFPVTIWSCDIWQKLQQVNVWRPQKAKVLIFKATILCSGHSEIYGTFADALFWQAFPGHYYKSRSSTNFQIWQKLSIF